MVLRNVAPKCNLYNSSGVIVTKLMSNVIGICFPNNLENELYLPRIDLSPSDSRLPFKLVRQQFPIKPAYAMTMNKSQGQTFDKVGLYFPAECSTVCRFIKRIEKNGFLSRHRENSTARY